MNKGLLTLKQNQIFAFLAANFCKKDVAIRMFHSDSTRNLQSAFSAVAKTENSQKCPATLILLEPDS